MTSEEVEIANRCKTDTARRQRAAADDTITEELGNGMKRSVQFDVGYDHIAFPEDCGGGGHGKHGMTIRFLLTGPHGVVQWVVNLPNWIPGHVDITDNVTVTQSVSAVTIDPRRYRFGDGMPVDLGYHSPTPRWEGQEQYGRQCDYLPEGYCYYDGSSLNAGSILAAFLEHGPHVVWASLARYYTDVLTKETDA